MINMKEIFAFDRISDQPCESVPLTDSERNNYLLAGGDLLFARQSLTYEGAGKCSLVLDAEGDRTWESHLIRVRLNRSIAVPEYYYYYFRSPAGRASIETIIQQVAAAGVRGSDLRRLRVPSVPIVEQRAVAEALGALDDKIAVNTDIAATADALVRALLGDTPSIGSLELDRLVKLVKTQIDPRAVDPDMPYVGLEHVPRRMMWLTASGVAGSVTSAKFSFKRGDILFGKLRPYFHKVAAAPMDGVCSTDILVTRSLDPALDGFALATLASDLVVEQCTAASEGTRMPRTSWKDLAAIQVPWPGEVAARSLSRDITAIRAAVEAALQENHSLAATRDALIPALMSRRLRVRDAERIVDDVL